MVPLGESVKGSLYYEDEYGEYKEIGRTVSMPEIAPGGIVSNNYSFTSSGSLSVTLKTFKRKRFKKLLMAKGFDRNSAESISRTDKNRTAIGLAMYICHRGGII